MSEQVIEKQEGVDKRGSVSIVDMSKAKATQLKSVNQNTFFIDTVFEASLSKKQRHVFQQVLEHPKEAPPFKTITSFARFCGVNKSVIYAVMNNPGTRERIKEIFDYKLSPENPIACKVLDNLIDNACKSDNPKWVELYMRYAGHDTMEEGDKINNVQILVEKPLPIEDMRKRAQELKEKERRE